MCSFDCPGRILSSGIYWVTSNSLFHSEELPATLFSTVTVTIQTSSVRGFQFPHVPVGACACLLNLERRHPRECEVVHVDIRH